MAWYDRIFRPFDFATRALGDTPNNIVPPRSVTRAGSMTVSSDSAQKASAVWAALDFRAGVLSSMPLQIKRTMPTGVVQTVTAPNLQIDGIGGSLDFEEWIYNTQVDLDFLGNTFGLIKQFDSFGRPVVIELADALQVSVVRKAGNLTYKIGGESYPASQIWHERAYTRSGAPLGLSPLRYAALSVGQNLSALQFGLDYFQNPGLPTAHVKNTNRVLDPAVAEQAKRRYKASVEHRDVWVTGKDWDVDIKSIAANESQFIETMNMTNLDIARFFGVPADLIDVPSPTGSITYANVTQRNMQFLITKLHPILHRREQRFSRALLPNKVFAKFDTRELLRLDPISEAVMHATEVSARLRAPSEIRAEHELAPFTQEQIEEMTNLGIIGSPVMLPPTPKTPIKPEI